MPLKQSHKEWLINRGISEIILNEFEISSAYNRIVIPVKDSHGIVLYNKYRRDPEEKEGPKYTYDAGGSVRLFNIGILSKVKSVIICEGELDVLCLKSHGFDAVTSTGGAQSFQKDWVPFFKDLEVFICLDNDKAGEVGTLKIAQMIPTAKVISLPASCKDATDFFMQDLQYKFADLMKVATALPIKEEMPLPKARKSKTGTRVQQAKDVPLDTLIKFNSTGKAKCPFHGEDKTPSLHKYNNNTWHCFGCGAGRDTIDFIMKRENLDFNSAVDYLLQ